MSQPWEKDAWFLHNIEQFLNGKETFRGAMIQAFIAGCRWQAEAMPAAQAQEKKL